MALPFPFPKGDMTMDLDLATFLTALYVIVDALYQSHIHPLRPARGGPPAEMSDSAVLCLGLASQWRSGVPRQSERGVSRYVHKHLGHLLPLLLSPSAFKRRLHPLWGAFLVLQEAVAKTLVTPQDHEVMDGFPIPSGNVQERWVAELLVSNRAGQPRLQGPLHPETHQPKVTPPTEWMSPAPRCGSASHKPMMTDSGFRGADWLAHWAEAYGAQVCPKPQQASRAECQRWSSARQVV